jgi:hypothetical protein
MNRVVWCVVGGRYTPIYTVLIHQCLLGLLVSAPSLSCEGRGFEPPQRFGAGSDHSSFDRGWWPFGSNPSGRWTFMPMTRSRSRARSGLSSLSAAIRASLIRLDANVSKRCHHDLEVPPCRFQTCRIPLDSLRWKHITVHPRQRGLYTVVASRCVRCLLH